jgi:hypothetical protein
MNKFMGVSIPVAFRSAGNRILNKMVDFKVYQYNRSFIAVPQISTEQRRMADLPLEMVFECSGRTVISSRGEGERNMDVLKDILEELTIKFNV